MSRILVTGGAGYIGCILVPKLVALGHTVTVFDCLLFGKEGLGSVLDQVEVIQGDLRDHDQVGAVLGKGFDVVIHLAAISNDPCSDLDPDLTTGVNLHGTTNLMNRAKEAGVKRFLYASSASVYGIKEGEDVTEDLSLEPITLYAKYKAQGEDVLNALVDDSFVGVSVRAATVCGYSPRLRLDLTINILTSHAITKGAIRVFGGSQMRPNIHIQDLTDFYISLLDQPAAAVSGRAFNVSRENSTVLGLAEMIRDEVDPAIPIDIVPSQDLRSYHLSGAKAQRELGFLPQYTLQQAVADLRNAFTAGEISDVEDIRYRNIAVMKQHPEFWTR